MIKQEGKKWCLYSKDGSKKLGEFDSEQAAKDREDEIRKAKYANNQLLVNISSLVNNSEIRTETIEGVDFTVLPSKTLPPNIVMNGILYPTDDVAKTIKTLDGSPVTLGHPVVNGKFADAYDMMSQAKHGLGGAFNKLRGQAEDGSWLVDKYIPTEQLQNTKRGKNLAEAIKHKQPIHTSTGVYLKRIPELGTNESGQDYKYRAEIDGFNHDAILLNEEGAATPSQGVGIFVNADGAPEEVEVMYVNMPNGEEEGVEGKVILELKGGRLAALLDAIKNMVKSTPEQESIQNHDREGNIVEKEEVLKMIQDATAPLAVNSDAIAKAVADGIAAGLAANAKAQADAEKAKLVEQVVNAKLMTEAAAKECGVVALQEMVANQKLPAAGLLPGRSSDQESDIFANYKIED